MREHMHTEGWYRTLSTLYVAMTIVSSLHLPQTSVSTLCGGLALLGPNTTQGLNIFGI